MQLERLKIQNFRNLRYFEEIEQVLEQDPNETLKGDSQIIVTTHDPMMIGSLRKEQVRILRTAGGNTTVDEPREHPRGMGVAGLLKSEYFGLPSTLDSDTLSKLQKPGAARSLRAALMNKTEFESRRRLIFSD